MKYESYIFDLYGTLVDIRTDEEKQELWEKLALFFGYYDAHYTPQELKKRYGELVSGKEEAMRKKQSEDMQKEDDTHEAHPEIQIERVFAALFEEKNVRADEALAIHTGQFFRILSTEYIRLYEGVIPVLEALKNAGKKVYLLSNAQRIFTEYEMHTLGIAAYFDDIFISSECGVKKPDVRFFQMLLERHQIDVNRAIMIGNDAKSDIAGAKNVGLTTCYIHSNISPELPVKKMKNQQGKVMEQLIMPEADLVLSEMDMERLLTLL